MREVYQHLYTETHYSDHRKKKSPGVRFMPLYLHWVKGKVIDLGCGMGGVVDILRQIGFRADGIDWVDLDNGMMVGDITEDLNLKGRYDTAICMDVLEHISYEKTEDVLRNLWNVKRQVMSFQFGPSGWKGPNGEELHINQIGFGEWQKLLHKHFDIRKVMEPRPNKKMYLSYSRYVD